jgi:prohibitin 2
MRKKNKMEDTDVLKKILEIAVPILIIFILLTGTIYIIPAGDRGVLLTFGKPSQQAMGEGLHLKWPIAQKIVKMDVKTLRFDAPKASSASKDLQIVTTDVTINYRISPESVPKIYQEIGLNYENKIIVPAVQEVLKSATAKYTAEELITRRPEAKNDIDMALREILLRSNIIVTEVSITNFDFSPEFNSAIENKVTQEQNALAAKNKLEQTKYEAQQQVVAAQGQADAQALLAKAVNSQTLEYQSLLNQKAAIDKWDGKLPTFVSGGNMPFIGNIGNLGNSSI